ncbi:MAG: TlpA family protein disulfide reductase [Bacteroidaceae bacterium]|nr:TlpA family protein disulfide reductase [Bacteroidaceae bacterium]
MKGKILTFIWVMLGMTMWAQKKVVWEEPAKGYSPYPQFEISRVELTKERTTLQVRYTHPHTSWFQVSKGSYLESNGKRYAIIGSDSITLGEQHYTDEITWMKDFVLYFKSLPIDTKEFDFMESTAPNDFKVFNIHEKGYTMPVTPVPDEYKADYAEEDVMEDLKYSDQPAVIHFKSTNYRKGMNTEIQVQYVDMKNPADPVDAKARLNDDGEADLSLPISFPQVVYAALYNIPWASHCGLYLAPGKEVTVLIDMLKDDSGINSKFVGFKGYFAKFDKDLYPMMVECEKSVSEAMEKQPKWKDIHEVKTLIDAFEQESAIWKALPSRLSYSKTAVEYMVSQIDDPPVYLESVADSLMHTKEFTDYILQHCTQNLYSPKAVFSNRFVDVSKYYVMADAKGINADLARYCYYLPLVLQGKNVAKPLIEDKALSDLYDKYVDEYRKNVASNKEGVAEDAHVHYLDMADVEPKEALPAILDRYKGKVVMIDIWATWCAPCWVGIEQMKPLKEKLHDKDIVYVYITSSTSPFDTWKELIPDIKGEQYYLTDEQCLSVMQQYESEGYPTYAIYSPDGNLTFQTIGFPGVEKIKEELEKAIGDK